VDLEADYESAVSRERDRQNQFGLLLGLACLAVGLLTDRAVSPAVFEIALAAKAVNAIVTLGAVALLAHARSAAVREVAVLAGTAFAVAVQVRVCMDVPGDYLMSYYLMAGFYALCINFVCAFRPGQAIRNAAAVAATYFLGVHLGADPATLSGTPIGGAVGLFAAGTLLSAVVPMQHERSRRRVFLSERRAFEANARLEALLRTDALTGVSNRRAFDEVLERTVARAHTGSQPLGLLLIDVDHFKTYNDLFGHPAGDACLQAIAQCLARTVRAGDTVCRYGGEEFVVVLSEGVTVETATAAGERLRDAIERMALPHPRQDGAVVTISLGAVVMLPAPGSSGEEVIALADMALYASKRNGRNRVTVADDRPGPNGEPGAVASAA
jgi:diguanylate cyclase (GGDEF)-like protein